MQESNDFILLNHCISPAKEDAGKQWFYITKSLLLPSNDTDTGQQWFCTCIGITITKPEGSNGHVSSNLLKLHITKPLLLSIEFKLYYLRLEKFHCNLIHTQRHERRHVCMHSHTQTHTFGQGHYLRAREATPYLSQSSSKSVYWFWRWLKRHILIRDRQTDRQRLRQTHIHNAIWNSQSRFSVNHN